MALSYYAAEVRQLMDYDLNTIASYVLLSLLWATKGSLQILILLLVLMLALKSSDATDLAIRQRPQRAHSRPRRLRRWSLSPRRQRSWLRPPGFPLFVSWPLSRVRARDQPSVRFVINSCPEKAQPQQPPVQAFRRAPSSAGVDQSSLSQTDIVDGASSGALDLH